MLRVIHLILYLKAILILYQYTEKNKILVHLLCVMKLYNATNWPDVRILAAVESEISDLCTSGFGRTLLLKMLLPHTTLADVVIVPFLAWAEIAHRACMLMWHTVIFCRQADGLLGRHLCFQWIHDRDQRGCHVAPVNLCAEVRQQTVSAELHPTCGICEYVLWRSR